MMGMASSSGAGKSGNFSTPSKDSKPGADNVERRANALAALKLICESQVFLPHLEALLAMQDAQVRNNFKVTVSLKKTEESLWSRHFFGSHFSGSCFCSYSHNLIKGLVRLPNGLNCLIQ